MDRASQSVMYGLWIVCLVGMATAIGIFSGWEANGWMGAATGGRRRLWQRRAGLTGAVAVFRPSLCTSVGLRLKACPMGRAYGMAKMLISLVMPRRVTLWVIGLRPRSLSRPAAAGCLSTALVANISWAVARCCTREAMLTVWPK